MQPPRLMPRQASGGKPAPEARSPTCCSAPACSCCAFHALQPRTDQAMDPALWWLPLPLPLTRAASRGGQLLLRGGSRGAAAACRRVCDHEVQLAQGLVDLLGHPQPPAAWQGATRMQRM